MKPKHYVAFLIILCSLFWFAMMSVAHLETLTTPRARALFLIPYIFVFGAGVLGLVYLFMEMTQMSQSLKRFRFFAKFDSMFQRGTDEKIKTT